MNKLKEKAYSFLLKKDKKKDKINIENRVGIIKYIGGNK